MVMSATNPRIYFVRTRSLTMCDLLESFNGTTVTSSPGITRTPQNFLPVSVPICYLKFGRDGANSVPHNSIMLISPPL